MSEVEILRAAEQAADVLLNGLVITIKEAKIDEKPEGFKIIQQLTEAITVMTQSLLVEKVKDRFGNLHAIYKLFKENRKSQGVEVSDSEDDEGSDNEEGSEYSEEGSEYNEGEEEGEGEEGSEYGDEVDEDEDDDEPVSRARPERSERVERSASNGEIRVEREIREERVRGVSRRS